MTLGGREGRREKTETGNISHKAVHTSEAQTQFILPLVEKILTDYLVGSRES